MILPPPRTIAVPALLAALLLFCTLGEGGDFPTVMLVAHGVLAALWAVLIMRPTLVAAETRLPAGPPLHAFAVFVLLALAGAALAPYRYAAFTLVQELAAFTAVAVLAARCGPGIRRYLPLPLLAGAAAQGLYVLFQRLAQGIDRPAGTFLNANHLGAWFVAALLLGLGTRPAGPSRSGWIVRIALALPAAAGLLASQSRGAYLGLAAGLAWLVIAAWRHLSRRSRTVLVAAACLAGVVLAVLLVQRFRTVDPYALHRVKIWRASVELVFDRPWTGTGPGQFASAAERYQFADGTAPLEYDRVFRRPHSDWLRVPCEFGVPASLALLAALALAAVAIRRGSARGGDFDASRAGATAALVGLLAHAGVENLSERPAVYLLAAALLGALIARPARRTSSVGPATGISFAARGLACVALVVAFVTGDAAPYSAWHLTRAGEDGRPAAPHELEAALRYNPVQPYLWMRLAEYRAAEGPAGRSLDGYALAREAAERAVRLHPEDGSLRLRLARIEARACRSLFRDLQSRDRAAARYREAEEVSRPSALLPLEAGEFLYGTSDFRGAQDAARRAADLEPESPAPLLLEARSVLQLDSGEAVEAARALLQRAEALEREHSGVERQNEYTRLLLDLDPDAVRWVRDRIRLLDVPQRP